MIDHRWPRLGALLLLLSGNPLAAGVVDPDCTVGKAVKSATMKATVGVSGRCGPAEAATDTAKRAAGIEPKGPVEKRLDDDQSTAKRAAQTTRKAIVD
jgi:hypothetical protein